MKILVIGSGGREHAIVWSLSRTSSTPVEIFCAPGNAGITKSAQILPTSVLDQDGLVELARAREIDLTFVGPEAPLVDGIVDRFSSEGLPIVGPSAAAARLEGSKVFAKDFMSRNDIPTAKYRVASKPDEAISILRSGEFGSESNPVVIKADGLAAGKGVVVANSRTQAEMAVESLMIDHQAGAEAAQQIVIEEALVGVEASLLLFADGRDYQLMPAARDHKRIGEGDTGPNTGGMGSVTDPSILDSETLEVAVKRIVEPTLAGAEREGFPFCGILFLGLMLTSDGPQLLEYNVRFGDPETQAILIRLKTDLSQVFDSMYRRELGRFSLDWIPGSSACVVAANPGYPGKHQSGAVISGLSDNNNEAVQVFHAGTSFSSDSAEFVATGGRVLGVTAAASTLPKALELCYERLNRISWPGMQFRRDIGRSIIDR